MKTHLALVFTALLLAPTLARAQGKLNVMTTTEDLASIALPAGKDQELIQALIELLLSATSAPAVAEGGNDEPQADR